MSSGTRPSKQQKTTFKRGAVVVTPQITPRVGLGNRQWVKMIYSRRGQFGAAASGGAANAQFRLNSINEPAVGLPGQPFGHDQMQQLFEKYCVVSCRYRIVFCNTNTTQQAVVVVQVTDNPTTTTVLPDIIGQGQIEWKVLGAQNGSPSVVEFNGYANNPKIQGVTRENYLAEQNFTPNFGSNPQDISFLNLFTADSGTGTGPTVNYIIELEYNVLCIGGVLVPAS